MGSKERILPPELEFTVRAGQTTHHTAKRTQSFLERGLGGRTFVSTKVSHQNRALQKRGIKKARQRKTSAKRKQKKAATAKKRAQSASESARATAQNKHKAQTKPSTETRCEQVMLLTQIRKQKNSAGAEKKRARGETVNYQ